MTIIARIAAQALRAAAAICNAARICGKPADAVNAPPPAIRGKNRGRLRGWLSRGATTCVLAFGLLLAVAGDARAQDSRIPNPDFPELVATYNDADGDLGYNAFRAHCAAGSPALGEEFLVYDVDANEGFVCELVAGVSDGETQHSGCFFAYADGFDKNMIHSFSQGRGMGFPDCRDVIPHCPDSRKALSGNPFSACRPCSDFNLVESYPRCGFRPFSFSFSAGGTLSAARAGDSDIQSGEVVPDGATVTFTAVPDSGNRISRWSGACATVSAAASACVVTATAAVQAGVAFAADCAGRFRAAGADALSCGDCVAGRGEINRRCVHRTDALLETMDTCRGVFGGSWRPAGTGSRCSGIDINDTFCLANSPSALSCRGFFNHVRTCNLLGRPALDPFHCAGVCASGRAAGRRCLE